MRRQTFKSPMDQAIFKVDRRREALLKKIQERDKKATDLNITGIIGVPSSDSYRNCLKEFLKTPPKVEVFPFGQGNASYKQDIEAYLNKELVKYNDLLAVLEQSPEAIRIHLEDLQEKLQELVNHLDKTPKPASTGGRKDPLFSNTQRVRREDETFIRQTEEQIAKYSAMLVALPPTDHPKKK